MKITSTLKWAVLCCCCLAINSLMAQGYAVVQTNWSEINEVTAISLSADEPQIQAKKAGYYELDFNSVYANLLTAEDDDLIRIPTVNGGFMDLVLTENTTMSQGLKEAYPSIRSFNVVTPMGRNTWGKLDVSPKGLRVMLMRPGKSTVYLDPVYQHQTNVYMVYERSEFFTDKSMDCHVNGRNTVEHDHAKAGDPYNDCELKTYRLAVAATGEYTSFHGGTVEDALAAMITTMNRVIGVYERDFGVSFTLIENVTDIIYTNAASDPYTNGNPGAMIGENQTNIDNVIGSANYDVGHVFGTNSGGLAGLGVTCSNGQKARGVTGSAAPVGDPFDIDYVAHELGHQFGGNHSFNNACGGNRNNGTAVEPGSGSSIMAYAGICAPNVQNNSDDHFHGVNMREIGIEISNDNCPVVSPVDNVAPEIGDLAEVQYIPIGTPFLLAAPATDADGDSLTYCWEQMDIEISDQPPVGTSTGGPNFRSNSPTPDSIRYFPTLETLASNGPFTWEVVPTVAREMNFRVSVRDNFVGGGCTQYDDIAVQSVAEAGPFVVTYPSAFGISWDAYAFETITWNVANTTAAPLNADLVDVFLSIDGGETYDILLADDTENDGELTIQVPNIDTEDARVMVINSAGTFFDVSNNDFEINVIDNGFYFNTTFVGEELCQGNEVNFTVDVVEIGVFGDEIDITVTEEPTNGEHILSQDVAVVGDAIEVTINGLDDTPAGVYNFTLTGTSGDFSNSISFPIAVEDANPQPASLSAPEDEATALPLDVILSWEDNLTVGMTYTMELATDQDFTNIIDTQTGLTESNAIAEGLDSETTYFWRVSNVTSCATSAPSDAFSFTTFICETDINDTETVIPSDKPAEILSQISIETEAVVADVNVLNVEGSHPVMSELAFSLISPTGTEVSLANGLCGLNLTIQTNGDVDVSTPGTIAGSYESSGAADFGGNIPAGGLSGTVVQAFDGSANPEELCNAAVNGDDIDGNIAIIMRGNCPFVDKVLNAQDAGAIGVIIVNNIPGDGFFDMGGTSTQISIPAVMMNYEDGTLLIDNLGGDSEGFAFSFDDDALEFDIPCPATDGGTYVPAEALSVFNGENAMGQWTLKVVDSKTGNGGSLDNWQLDICFSDEDVDGLEELASFQSSVYPNPTSSTLTIALENLIADRIRVWDIAGRQLASANPSTSMTEIDMSRFESGVYFVEIEVEGYKAAVHRIVRQ